jgi:hypothetical protein
LLHKRKKIYKYRYDYNNIISIEGGRIYLNRKIIGIFVCTLLIVTAIPAIGNMNIEKIDVKEVSIPKTSPSQPCPIWTVQFYFDVQAASGGLGNAGAEYANGYFYSTRWASNEIHEYTSTGVLNRQFTIGGVSALRDLAYCPANGHFYGGTGGSTIYEMDFSPPNPILLNTYTGNYQVRAIAYDDNLDVLYVSNWGDPVWVVDRTSGTILSQFDLVSTVGTYGFAYDNYCNGGGPYLWVFDQGGSGAEIHQWDLSIAGFTGVWHDVITNFPGTGGIAGGLFFTKEFYPGQTTLGGMLQGTPDILFCYEICDVLVPKISCDPMTMNWVDVTTGSTVTGDFFVSNSGDVGSILHWSPYSWPAWMENPNPPVFNPPSGTIIGGTPGTTVTFTFTAPSAQFSTFVGTVVMQNDDDPFDFCNMTTDLTTPRNRGIFFNIFENLINQFPLLKILFGF